MRRWGHVADSLSDVPERRRFATFIAPGERDREESTKLQSGERFLFQRAAPSPRSGRRFLYLRIRSLECFAAWKLLSVCFRARKWFVAFLWVCTVLFEECVVLVWFRWVLKIFLPIYKLIFKDKFIWKSKKITMKTTLLAINRSINSMQNQLCIHRHSHFSKNINNSIVWEYINVQRYLKQLAGNATYFSQPHNHSNFRK